LSESENTTLEDFWGAPISCYSRAQAISEGTLVDVSDTAECQEAGFVVPVALTAAVFTLCVEVPECVADQQDVKGRLWDVLYMLALHGKGASSDRVSYTISVRNQPDALTEVFLVAVIGPGDTAAPVITVMLPGED